MKWLKVVLSVLAPFAVSAQEPANRPACKNPEFDQKVAKAIQFSIPVVSCEELYNWTCSGEEIIILDAREPKEYEISHIPGATYIGYNKFDAALLEAVQKKERIVVYCSIGYRSEKIGERIKALGYEHVYNLYGSIFEWGNLGFPLVDKNESPTNQIHTYNSRWAKWVLSDTLEKIY